MVSEGTGPPPDWYDLATNRPGAAASAQARSAKEAHPGRVILGRLLRVKNNEYAWRTGAKGEGLVGEQLQKLTAWHSLHAIPIGTRGSDIDHLVIGPGGVYTLNAKTHPGAQVWVGGNTLMINGHRVPYIRNSTFEAERTTELLSQACGLGVAVYPVIVLVKADTITIKSPPELVHIVARRKLAAWLEARPRVLAPERIDLIYEMARRSTTWQT